MTVDEPERLGKNPFFREFFGAMHGLEPHRPAMGGRPGLPAEYLRYKLVPSNFRRDAWISRTSSSSARIQGKSS